MVDINYLLIQCEVSEQLGMDNQDCPITCKQLLPILRELICLRQDNQKLLQEIKCLKHK